MLYQIVFFVPDDAKEAVKQAMFAAGAGHIGHYEACAWETLGRGQFLPQKGANPNRGSIGQLSKFEEWRIEMAIPENRLLDAITALKHAHPYEKPAYHVVQVVDI